MNNQKHIWIWIFVAIILTIIIAMALFTKENNQKQTSRSTINSSTASISSIKLPNSIVEASLAGSVLRYTDSSTGNFTSLDLATGKRQQFSPYLITGTHTTWSSDGTKILNISSDDGTASMIDIQKNNGGVNNGSNKTDNLGVISDLSTQVLTPTWSGDGKQILYQYIDKATYQSMITVADPDGTNWQDIVAAPVTFSNLWWSPLGTYAIGLESYTDNDPTYPPKYYLIAISSKKITKLVGGEGNLKWSPSGKLALLDSTDGKSLTVVDVTTGVITTLNVPGLVAQFTWQDETHLVGIDNGKVVSLDLSTKKIQEITNAPSKIDYLLGIYKKDLLYVYGQTVADINLN